MVESNTFFSLTYVITTKSRKAYAFENYANRITVSFLCTSRQAMFACLYFWYLTELHKYTQIQRVNLANEFTAPVNYLDE